MYPYSTAGFQQCCVQCECVCVCVPDSRRGGAATVSHLKQVTPHRKAKCWGLQHFYLAPRKTHTKREREGGRGSHTWLNKSFSWIQQRETWATHLKVEEIQKPVCALRKWKDKETDKTHIVTVTQKNLSAQMGFFWACLFILVCKCCQYLVSLWTGCSSCTDMWAYDKEDFTSSLGLFVEHWLLLLLCGCRALATTGWTVPPNRSAPRSAGCEGALLAVSSSPQAAWSDARSEHMK